MTEAEKEVRTEIIAGLLGVVLELRLKGDLNIGGCIVGPKATVQAIVKHIEEQL